MDLARVGPARQAGHDVELAEQIGNDLFGVGASGQPIHLGDDFLEGGFSVAEGLIAEVLALGLETSMVFHKLFAVKL